MAAQTPEQIAAQLRKDAEQLKGDSVRGKVVKQVRMAMIADVQDHFATSSGPDGQPWPALKWPRPQGGNKPLWNTGILRGSITGTGPDHIERITPDSVEIGTTRKGANLMHAGGTVRPVSARALAIPITVEAVRSGGPRNFPRPLFMIWRQGAPSGVLAEKNRGRSRGRQRGGITAHFALVKKVVIPPRPFVGFGQKLITRIESIMTNAMQFAFGGRATGGGSQVTNG